MKIEKKSKVKILFKNGIWVEGVVSDWNDDEAILIAPNGHQMIVVAPKENLMLIKILPQVNLSKTELEEDLEKTIEAPSADINRITKIVDLKTKLIQAEKEIVLEKSRAHTLSGDARNVQYGTPGLFKK